MAKPREPFQERGVMMTPSMWRNLRILAAKTDRTASALIREAIEDLLERHEAIKDEGKH